jgi:ethanolamine utilization protein EutQ (cupin superfamily)
MTQYRVDFAAMEWESPMEGLRFKLVKMGDRQLRLVEYTKDMAPHWCEKGHIGYVLEGRLEVELENETVVFGPGDGALLPSGAEHKHLGRALTDTVRVVFVEDV